MSPKNSIAGAIPSFVHETRLNSSVNTVINDLEQLTKRLVEEKTIIERSLPPLMAIKLAEMSDQELANKLLEVIDSLEAVQNELKTNKEIEHPSVLTKRINDYQKKILSLNGDMISDDAANESALFIEENGRKVNAIINLFKKAYPLQQMQALLLVELKKRDLPSKNS